MMLQATQLSRNPPPMLFKGREGAPITASYRTACNVVLWKVRAGERTDTAASAAQRDSTSREEERFADERVARPTAILLHCSASGGRQWAGMNALLRERMNVVTPDLGGHGEDNAWINTGISTLEADARRIGQLLERMPGAHLVGHSYGGVVALKVASRWPQWVRSVTVYEPVLMRWLFDDKEYSQSSRTLLALACNLRYAQRDGASVKAARMFIDFWSGDGAWDRLSASQRQGILRTLPAVMGHFEALFADDIDATPLAGVPLLHLTGEHTHPVAWDMSQVASKRLPQADFRECEALAHMGPITHPLEVGVKVARFVAQAEARSQAMAGAEG